MRVFLVRHRAASDSHQRQTCEPITTAKVASLAHLAHPFICRVGLVSLFIDRGYKIATPTVEKYTTARQIKEINRKHGRRE